MNPTILKFFLVGGVVLVISGILQVVVRPPENGEKGVARYINGATVRAVMFVAVGVFAVLLGLEVVPLRSVLF